MVWKTSVNVFVQTPGVCSCVDGKPVIIGL